MGFVVKNTTKWSPLDWVCPHTCRGCGKLGSVFCECCKKYMLEQRREICPICKREVAEKDKNVENGDDEAGVEGSGAKGDFGGDNNEQAEGMEGCVGCESVFEGIWAVGWREGALSKLVSEYKYKSVRACGEVLAGLLDAVIPEGALEVSEDVLEVSSGTSGVPAEGVGDLGRRKVVVVPLPTIGRHVRDRGVDHTWQLAKKLARRRGWRCERILGRKNDTVQVGAKMKERQEQAARAYEVCGVIDEVMTYVLLDDVWTTGSSMMSAAKVMVEGGAKKICAVVVEVGRDKDELGVKNEAK